MSKTEQAYFRAAKAVAELSDYPRHKLGCVVVKGHKIISSGCNSKSRCHRVQAQLDIARFGPGSPGKLHAEVDALLPLIKNGTDLSHTTLYVYRQHKDGTLACARPCSSCQQLIKKMGIKRVFYTTEDGYAREDFKM